jgi:hypothetical protein
MILFLSHKCKLNFNPTSYIAILYQDASPSPGSPPALHPPSIGVPSLCRKRVSFFIPLSLLDQIGSLSKDRPWDDDKPFQANITDNGALTCWINMSYRDHNLWQRGIPPIQDVIQSQGPWDFRDWVFECRSFI